MNEQGTTVLLCGVRHDFAKAMKNLGFEIWFPADQLFAEEQEKFSATLKAVRYVHEVFKDNPCPHCQQNGMGTDRHAHYYLV